MNTAPQIAHDLEISLGELFRGCAKRGLSVGLPSSNMTFSMDRCRFLSAAVAAPMIHLGRVRLFGAEYSTRAVDLMKSSTVTDMLSPFRFSHDGDAVEA